MSGSPDAERSGALFARATARIPGGVNSPVRAFRAVGRTPVFIARARGARIWDEDGNEYIDYVGSWGPMILGHAHPGVTAAVREALEAGTSFGAPTSREVAMAELIARLIPSVEMVRMVNSGTEATMSALRLARAFTGREKVIKFEGCYHGHSDAFLIRAGSGATTLSVPDSPGVPAAVARGTLNASFNDSAGVEALLESHAGEVAAVIVEPVAGNMGCVCPRPHFLEELRRLCTKHGALLVFDEVMTGFRLAPGGAQQVYGVRPDLTTLGKIIGGGLPVGAYGGRRDVMSLIAPSGPVYQAGTLSGNPLAMAAGLATLNELAAHPGIYDTLEERARGLAGGVADLIRSLGLPCSYNRAGSMATLFFTPGPVEEYEGALRADTARFAAYFREMLARGIYLPPSQFEAAFVSSAHTEEDIARTIDAARAALKTAFA